MAPGLMTIQEYNRLIPHTMGYDEFRGTFRCSSCIREGYLTDDGFEAIVAGKLVRLDGTYGTTGILISYPHRGSRGGLVMQTTQVMAC